jgi:uncharacterized protein YjeT (DUF2065 family)
MRELLLALGLMAVVEGLVLALAPLRFDKLIKALSQLTLHQRRTIGLAAVTFGVALVWVARSL